MHDDAGPSVLNLAELLRVIRRRWRWVAGACVVMVALALALSLQQTPKYVASATILLRTVASDDLVGLDPNAQVPFFADRQLSNEIQVIESTEVRQQVETVYAGDLDVDSVTAEVDEVGSDALRLSATGDDADAVADLVNTYAQTYIDYSQTERVDDLLAAGTEVQSRLDELDAERDALTASLDEIDAQLAADPNNPELLRQRAEIADSIDAELDALDSQRAFYRQQMEDLQLTAGLTQVGGARLIEEAEPPAEPVSPKPVRDAVIGLMAGLAIGIGFALAREFLDESIRGVSDLERALGADVPTLATIPQSSVLDDRRIAEDESGSVVAEAFRSLRTAVRFAGLDRSVRVIQITSVTPGDGKTTAAANLALMLDQAGHSVAVVCCDLRRPTIHEVFDVEVGPGLADVVMGEHALSDAMKQVGDQLYVLPAGTRPPNPSELLTSARAERVIDTLAQQMDYVIVDSPPILAVTDPVVVSRMVEATVLVVAAGTTKRHQLRAALSTLRQADAPLIGTILNRAGTGDTNAYGYTYGASYVHGTAGPAPAETA